MNTPELLVHIIAPATVHDDSKYFLIAQSLINFKPAIVTRVSRTINESRELCSDASTRIEGTAALNQSELASKVKSIRPVTFRHSLKRPSHVHNPSNEVDTNSKQKFNLERNFFNVADHSFNDSANRTESTSACVQRTSRSLPARDHQKLLVNNIHRPYVDNSYKRVLVESSSIRSIGSHVSDSQPIPKSEWKLPDTGQLLQKAPLLSANHFSEVQSTKLFSRRNSLGQFSRRKRCRLSCCTECCRISSQTDKCNIAQYRHQPPLNEALHIFDQISALPSLIHPPESAARMQISETHVTADLRNIVTNPALAEHFRPNYIARNVRALERGRWQFEIEIAAEEVVYRKREQQCKNQRSWSIFENIEGCGAAGGSEDFSSTHAAVTQKNSPVRQTRCIWTTDEFRLFWEAMAVSTKEGKLGWGTRIFLEVYPVEFCRFKRPIKKAVRVLVMVFSWAEVLEHIWLMIWVSSNNRSSTIPMQWIAADGTVVVSTGEENSEQNSD